MDSLRTIINRLQDVKTAISAQARVITMMAEALRDAPPEQKEHQGDMWIKRILIAAEKIQTLQDD